MMRIIVVVVRSCSVGVVVLADSVWKTCGVCVCVYVFRLLIGTRDIGTDETSRLLPQSASVVILLDNVMNNSLLSSFVTTL